MIIVTVFFASSAFAKDVPVPPKRPASLEKKVEVTPPVPMFNQSIFGAALNDGKVVIHNPLPPVEEKPWYMFW